MEKTVLLTKNSLLLDLRSVLQKAARRFAALTQTPVQARLLPASYRLTRSHLNVENLREQAT
jgi:hypothetical protein